MMLAKKHAFWPASFFYGLNTEAKAFILLS
jgi:hypothetical protein